MRSRPNPESRAWPRALSCLLYRRVLPGAAQGHRTHIADVRPDPVAIPLGGVEWPTLLAIPPPGVEWLTTPVRQFLPGAALSIQTNAPET